MPARGGDPGPWVLALDVGTSSVRSALYDGRGRSLTAGPILQLSCRWVTSAEGAMQASAAALLEHVHQAIDAAVARARAEGILVEAVTIAAFWHSLLAVDAEGDPLTPVFGWGDTRAADAAERLGEMLGAADLHRRTGCFPHPSYPAAKLLWLRETQPRLFRRADRWLGFGEFLMLRLFGEPHGSLSMASGMGLLDYRTRAWDEPVLAALEVGAEQLPSIDPSEPAGTGLRTEYAQRWPELARVPWLPPIGDGACANVGSGAVGRDRFGLTVGTSAAMRLLWEGGEELDIAPTLWCYRVDERRLVAGRALSNGGNLAATFGRGLQLPPPAEREAALAAIAPDSHGLTVLPYFLGERGPRWRLERGAAVVGATGATSAIEVLRAGLESVAFGIGRIYTALEAAVGAPSELLAGGGALHASRVWTQIIADVLGRQLTLTQDEETTSRGAALLALERLGAIADLAEAVPPGGERFEPDPRRHERYRAAAERQRSMEELLLPWMARAHGAPEAPSHARAAQEGPPPHAPEMQ